MKINSRAMSLTSRVILFVAVATILCLIILVAVVQSSIQHHFAEQDAGELQVVADSVQLVLQQPKNNEAQLATALSTAVSGHHEVFFLVMNQQDQVVYATPGADL